MKRFAIIVILFMVVAQYSFSQTQKIKKINMKAVQFIPKAFHDVKLGYEQDVIHALTPHYPETEYVMKNEIAINIPQKIIFNPKEDDFTPIIPVCGFFVITSRRGLKFIDKIALLIHIKKADEEEWFSGEIIEDYEDEIPDIPEWTEKEEEERQQRIKEAQKYTLEELEDGTAAALAININALKYVKMPITSGFYDIYISKSGLESNRMQVEIVFEK